MLIYVQMSTHSNSYGLLHKGYVRRWVEKFSPEMFTFDIRTSVINFLFSKPKKPGLGSGETGFRFRKRLVWVR